MRKVSEQRVDIEGIEHGCLDRQVQRGDSASAGDENILLNWDCVIAPGDEYVK